MYDFDILIIGGGPGGYVAGAYAAQFGKNVAVVEKELLGGCCLNVGCIPTKTILEAANIYVHAIGSSDYGIKTNDVEFSWKNYKAYSEKVRSDLRNGVSALLRSRKCSLINGEAFLVDEHKVKIGEQIITADIIILATGSCPSIPGVYADMKHVITSDSFWDIEELPKSIVIVGGGIIGCEIASALSRLGTKVIIVEQMPEILPMFDFEAVKYLRQELINYGVDIICGEPVNSIIESHDDLKVIVGDKTIECDYLLWSTGRRANIINTDNVKLKLTDSGFVDVDNNYRTSIGNIYCIGDANGKNMLAHAAISQAMLVVKYLCAETEIRYDPFVPQTVFTSPSIARIGLSEDECSSMTYAVGKVPYSAVGYSHVVEKENGYYKVIRDITTDTLLGAEIVGYNACELIHNLVPYINKKIEINMFSDIIYAHPTLTEGIKLAIEASYIKSPQA